MAEFDILPTAATLKPSRFRVFIPEEQLKEFKTAIQMSKVGPKTHENQDESGKWGITHQWLTDAKAYWEKKFDWRATESYINSFTNYEVVIKDEGEDGSGKSFAIHFTGLFSQAADAIPIILMHGWPGSFMEFLKIIQRLRGKYSADELPYHIIVPSLPGYAFSTGPPLDIDWTTVDTARIMHKLMLGLGFETGYVTQGGDIGASLARIMAAKYDSCKAMHLNFCLMREPPKGLPENSLTKQESENMARAGEFGSTGSAYALMQGTKPATIGLVLSSSPLALLAWIGEKFLAWTDVDPSIEDILESVSLYWLTSTYPRAIYPYASSFPSLRSTKPSMHADPQYHVIKPFGYSYFPKELVPIPVSWVRMTGNLIWSRNHTEGGHFAAMEKPELLLQDIEDFVAELK